MELAHNFYWSFPVYLQMLISVWKGVEWVSHCRGVMAKSSSSLLTLSTTSGIFHSSVLFALLISHMLIVWCWGVALVLVFLVGRQKRNGLLCSTPGIDWPSGDVVSQGNKEKKETPIFSSSMGTPVPWDGIQAQWGNWHEVIFTVCITVLTWLYWIKTFLSLLLSQPQNTGGGAK